MCQLPAVASGGRFAPRELEALRSIVVQLQKRLAAARKDSSTSSNPPSSDIVKPPKPQPPPGESGASPAGSREIPRTSEFRSRPGCSFPASDYLLDAAGYGGHLLVTDDGELIVVQRRTSPP